MLVLIFGQSAATWYVWLPLPLVETPSSFDRPVRLPPGAPAAPLMIAEPAAMKLVCLSGRLLCMMLYCRFMLPFFFLFPEIVCEQRPSSDDISSGAQAISLQAGQRFVSFDDSGQRLLSIDESR